MKNNQQQQQQITTDYRDRAVMPLTYPKNNCDCESSEPSIIECTQAIFFVIAIFALFALVGG